MSATRVAQLIGGSLAALMAVGLLALGGFSLWAEGEKDRDGYLTTEQEGFATGSRALVTGNLDLDGVDWIVDTTDLGEVRLKVESTNGKPVFAGVARTSDVAAYLRGVERTTVRDIDMSPFLSPHDAHYRTHAGDRRPGRPARRDFWVASTQGTGEQTLSWDLEEGDWQVVVMNADGSPGVRADVRAGAKVPYLTALGWSSIGLGLLMLAGATALIVLGARTPRHEARAAAPAPAPEPAAS